MCNWIESRWGLSNMRGVARFKYLVGKCVSDVDSGGNVPEEVGVRGAGRGSEVPWWGGCISGHAMLAYIRKTKRGRDGWLPIRVEKEADSLFSL